MTTWPDEPGPDPGGAGDRDAAFSRFYRDTVGRLVGRCILMGVPEADAPDIVQKLMMDIYRQWPCIGSAEAYAWKAIPLRAVGFLILPRSLAIGEPDPSHPGRSLTSSLPDSVLAVEGEHLILQALRQLPGMQRVVFALVYDGYTAGEIAGILGLAQATVRSHLRYARDKLRLWWQQAGLSTEGRDQR
jgi:RNA polymerase sigma factor (sigma-70 family)